MKKVLFLLSVILMVFTSCSSESSQQNNNQALVLPSKLVYTNNSGQVYTTNYTYDGNKIMSANNNIINRLYTYENNLITKVEHRNPSSNYLYQQFFYTYDNLQRLVEELSKDQQNDYGVKSLYVYNSDGTVNLSVYSGTASVQNNLVGTYKYFIGTNGELVKSEIYSSSGTITDNYSYDTKNNPFKNILNYHKLHPIGNDNFNVTLITATNSSNVVIDTTTNAYVYNSDNYPVSVVTTSVNGGNTTTSSDQFFY